MFCFDIVVFLYNNKYSKVIKFIKNNEKTACYIQHGNKRDQLWRL